MTRDFGRIQEIDLLAYADGLLDADAAKKAAVEEFLACHPEAAERVAEIRAENEQVRVLYEKVVEEPVPERLLQALESGPRRGLRLAARYAAAAALLLAAAGGGWLAAQLDTREVPDAGAFAAHVALHLATAEATKAFRPTAGTGEAGRLPHWSTDRISLEIDPPDLSAAGYRLVAKERIGPAGQQMLRLTYRSGDSSTLRLFLRPRWEDGGGGVQSIRAGGRSIYYWLDGPLAFALASDGDSPDADRLVALIHDSIERARLVEGAPVLESRGKDNEDVHGSGALPMHEPSKQSELRGSTGQPVPVRSGPL